VGVEFSKGSLTVAMNGRSAVFPFFKNIGVRDGDTMSLEGLVLYSRKACKAYLPRDARRLFTPGSRTAKMPAK
jgi:hypothetical protein